MSRPLTCSPEVTTALADGAPVVALESTIISRGLPQPRNLEVARELEGIVRAGGACPATIAVIDGTPHVGLTDAGLEHIATGHVRKVGLRDLSVMAGLGGDGGTTVSATSFLAARAQTRITVVSAGVKSILGAS